MKFFKKFSLKKIIVNHYLKRYTFIIKFKKFKFLNKFNNYKLK